jgi:hypothetical protein
LQGTEPLAKLAQSADAKYAVCGTGGNQTGRPASPLDIK